MILAAFLVATRSDAAGLLIVALVVCLGVLASSSGTTCINCGRDFRRAPGSAAKCPDCGKRWDRYA